LVDRIGERRAMAFYYLAIALAFTGYAVTTNPAVMKVLYVIDNALFALGVSITTYLNRIVRPRELMPSLAMGQTMNHVAAVAIPVCGGLLWHRFGYHAPFWAGVVAALASFVITRRVPALTASPSDSPLPA
jgi:predicted MFS family arabinose efflux permease